MLLSLKSHLEMINRAMEETILPEVSSPYARGQVYAVMELLNQLFPRIEYRCDLLKEEIEGLKKVLKNLEGALTPLLNREIAGLEKFRREVAKIWDQAPANGDPLLDFRDLLNGLCANGLELLQAAQPRLDPDVYRESDKLVRAHLEYFGKRNLKLLQPSILMKISRGG